MFDQNSPTELGTDEPRELGSGPRSWDVLDCLQQEGRKHPIQVQVRQSNLENQTGLYLEAIGLFKDLTFAPTFLSSSP